MCHDDKYFCLLLMTFLYIAKKAAYSREQNKVNAVHGNYCVIVDCSMNHNLPLALSVFDSYWEHVHLKKYVMVRFLLIN